jgi:two-component system, chemotaxis family, chemotaxis protein CheY
MASTLPRPATILVVDDSEIVLTVTKTVLESVGYRVLTHPGPAGCVAVILQEKPDLVLIDVNMPKLGGETIVKLFGKAQPNSETIILLYSTLSTEHLRDKAQTSGAHGFIRKSEDSYDLVRQVGRWLKKDKIPTGPHSRPGRPPSRPPSSGQRKRPGAKASVPPPATPATQSRPPPKTSGATRLLPTVLFIDDDMEALSAMQRDVQGEPYTTDFALSVAQGLRALSGESRPALVVAALKESGVEVYEGAIDTDSDWSRRFVFVSPQKPDARGESFGNEYHGVILRRPVLGDDLRNAIRQKLAETTGDVRAGRGGSRS